ncbi:MAG: hypothetical protein DSY90_01965 [Deltaproteobacteria bacterium]|nr:MAG: hypothetical protein DSY90_01965 [Deltaproteobacteria bacterium]
MAALTVCRRYYPIIFRNFFPMNTAETRLKIAPADRILFSCARLEMHSVHRRRLAAACEGYTEWDALLHLAEAHGMGPLLNRHIAAAKLNVPPSFIRGLRLLALRHRQANTINVDSLREILSLARSEGLACLVLKGAALCHTLYPEIGLRPMRDIDLLLDAKDARHLHRLLQKEGFAASTQPIPPDHFHLPALYQTVGGLRVCVELHQGLYSPIPPYNQSPPFSVLYRDPISFDVNGITAHTLNNEAMLIHLFQHGFHAPLVFEPYKLISVADIISLVEKEVETIDWDKLRSACPHLFNSLQYFHYMTAWTDQVLTKIPLKNRAVPSGVGASYAGWPRVRLSGWRERGVVAMLRHTLFPLQWWMLIYYDQPERLTLIRSRHIRHWQHLYWWGRLFGAHFFEAALKKEAGPAPEGTEPERSLLKKIKILAAAIYRRFR